MISKRSNQTKRIPLTEREECRTRLRRAEAVHVDQDLGQGHRHGVKVAEEDGAEKRQGQKDAGAE